MTTWLDIEPSEYHALKAFGSSAIKCFAQDGPLQFHHDYIAKKNYFDSDAMRIGRSFHKAMEEPVTWQDWYVRVPTTIEHNELYDDAVFSMPEGTTAKIPEPGEPVSARRLFDKTYVGYFKLHAESNGLDWLNDDEIEIVKQQQQACWDNLAIREVLESDTKKVEVAAVKEHGHITIKALIDLLIQPKFWDFKTTKANNPHQYWRDFQRLGYGYQIAHYRLVTGIEEHGHIFVSNSAPFEAQIMDIPLRVIQHEWDKTQEHHDNLSQLIGQLNEHTGTDSQGIPFDFHNEPWGSVIDPTVMFLGEDDLI